MKTLIAALALILVVPALVAADELHEELLALDKSLWTAWAEQNGEVFRQHLTEDHVQVIAGTGMTVGREVIAAAVDSNECELASFEFHDATLRRISADVVMLSYTAVQEASCEGTPLPPKLYATSVFVEKEGQWLSASYQETRLD